MLIHSEYFFMIEPAYRVRQGKAKFTARSHSQARW